MTGTRSPSAVFIAAFLLAFAGGVAPLAGQAAPTQTATTQEALSDERVMELARGYFDLIQAGDYERVWEHLAPEARARHGTVERFRSDGERVLNQLGTELGIISEAVEPARVGMVADRLYIRVSHYSGAEGRPVRFLIGLVNDGTIAGLQVRPAS